MQKLLEEYKYYTGTFDEEGRFKAGCLRLKGSYTQLYTPEEATDWNVRTTLGYQLWDAHVDYGRLVPELSEKLKQLHDELGEEGKELR